MRRRRGWKRGDHLVRDEESGFVEYASKVGRGYYGTLTRKEEIDPVHPQEFVRALNDPFITDPQNPPQLSYDLFTYQVSSFVYGTNVPVPTGPASHLYNLGIGSMVIEGGTHDAFIVR